MCPPALAPLVSCNFFSVLLAQRAQGSSDGAVYCMLTDFLARKCLLPFVLKIPVSSLALSSVSLCFPRAGLPNFLQLCIHGHTRGHLSSQNQCKAPRNGERSFSGGGLFHRFSRALARIFCAQTRYEGREGQPQLAVTIGCVPLSLLCLGCSQSKRWRRDRRNVTG